MRQMSTRAGGDDAVPPGGQVPQPREPSTGGGAVRRSGDRSWAGGGWRRLEIGAGTLTELLAERATPAGPLRPRAREGCLLTRLVGSAVVETRYCDVVREPLPKSEFDVVHGRLLLELLPERGLVLGKMATAVRPGGLLLVEDLDWATRAAVPEARDVQRRVADAVLRLLGSRGYDPRYGRKLPALLRGRGLADVTSIARPVDTSTGVGRSQPVWQLHIDRLVPALLGRRLLDRADLDTVLALGLSGIHECFAPVLVSAWGRRNEVPVVVRPPAALTAGGSGSRGGAPGWGGRGAPGPGGDPR